MKTEATRRGRRVVAISGKHSVALAMQWPAEELDGLLGFSIRRQSPDRSIEWLPVVLRFEGEPIEKGKLYPSNEAPIQSMIWGDFGLSDDKTKQGLEAGSRFIYEVIPVRGEPGKLEREEEAAVRVVISTEPEHEHGPDEPEVHFNRGLSFMQEYERLFGEGHQPEDDPEALDWLARGLDSVIIDFINEAANDEEKRLDVAAYHLDEASVIDAICKLGKRARVSLDWGSEEKQDEPGPNAPALKKLTDAGVTVHKREHVSISHNKYMVLKKSDGSPLAVLTGSTNYTAGGISTQSNQSVIVRNPELARAYVADFERVLKNDNAGLREANKEGIKVSDALEVYFSPHSANDRPDLDRFKELAAGATSSRLFMTFRMTDHALISAMLDDSVPTFGVADRVYQGNDDSGDRLIYDEAHTADPRVVACNAPLDDEPDEDVLLRELKREGFNPIVHHKILLIDWDTPDCVVVTGSANYSTNSTEHNDENSLIVLGDQRLAEEYFVEFCRLFIHWRSRWLREREFHGEHPPEHLASDSSWTDLWARGGRPAQLLDVALGASGTTSADAAPEGAKGDGAQAGAVDSKPPGTAAGERIQHVVVLMLENRSFDQMLGQLEGVDGVTLDADGKDPNQVNYLDPQKPTKEGTFPVVEAEYFGIPEGDIPPPTIDEKTGTVTGLYGGPSHSFPAASQQIYNDSWGPSGSGAKDTTPATNSGFVKGYDGSLRRTYKDWAKKDPKFKAPKEPPRDHVEVAMASFSPEQLPVINGLAKEFCVCDRWFSEVPGPTEPNRLFMHAATSVGFVHNPWEYPVDARTIYEDIDEQGEKTWAFYYYDLSDSDNFPALKKQTDRVRKFESFAEDLKDPDTFPNYVFLCPRYSDSADGFANSQHAPYDVRYGDNWIADVYEALRGSEIWESTLLIVTYDEHGGFYDHVHPPDENILPPDSFTSPTAYDKKNYGYMFGKNGWPKTQYVFDFDRLGCRVPAVLVSPWVNKGLVENGRLQHTSVLATVRKMWGLRDQPLTAREGQAHTFDGIFEERDSPRDDCPMKLERPPLPERSLSAALDQPLSPVQLEIFAQVNHLDGHPDTGQPAPLPKTQGEMSKYIAERRKAHDAYHEAKGGAFSVYKDSAGEYRWRLVDGDGDIVASSGEGFATAAEARKQIALVRATTASASIKVEK